MVHIQSIIRTGLFSGFYFFQRAYIFRITNEFLTPIIIFSIIQMEFFILFLGELFLRLRHRINTHIYGNMYKQHCGLEYDSLYTLFFHYDVQLVYWIIRRKYVRNKIERSRIVFHFLHNTLLPFAILFLYYFSCKKWIIFIVCLM